MENRKRRKGPLIMLMLLCVCISMAAGIMIGRNNVISSPVIDFFAPETKLPRGTGEAPVVELQPVPEYTDGGYETTDIFEKVKHQCLRRYISFPCQQRYRYRNDRGRLHYNQRPRCGRRQQRKCGFQ